MSDRRSHPDPFRQPYNRGRRIDDMIISRIREQLFPTVVELVRDGIDYSSTPIMERAVAIVIAEYEEAGEQLNDPAHVIADDILLQLEIELRERESADLSPYSPPIDATRLGAEPLWTAFEDEDEAA